MLQAHLRANITTRWRESEILARIARDSRAIYSQLNVNCSATTLQWPDRHSGEQRAQVVRAARMLLRTLFYLERLS